MEISEYRDTDGLRRWELLYEGYHLVLLDNAKAPKPYASELLAFKNLRLVWRLSPKQGSGLDQIQDIYISNGKVHAGSFSGWNHEIDYKTGEVLSEYFTK